LPSHLASNDSIVEYVGIETPSDDEEDSQRKSWILYSNGILHKVVDNQIEKTFKLTYICTSLYDFDHFFDLNFEF